MRSFFTALLAVPLLFPANLSAQPELGVYVGPCDNDTLGFYEAWAGDVDRIVDFVPRETWNKLAYENIFGGWGVDPQQRNWTNNRKGRVVISLAMLPDSADYVGAYSEGVNGNFDGHWRSIADSMINNGYANATIRLGWEFNGSWYAFGIDRHHYSNNNPALRIQPATFIAYWQRIVNTMRSRSGANFKFNWNPNLMMNFDNPPGRYYPGNSYVNEIGLDVYDTCYEPNTYPLPAGASAAVKQQRREAAWNVIKTVYPVKDDPNFPKGLDGWVAFAAEKGKPLTVPEWGVVQRVSQQGNLQNSGEDNAYYIEQMHNWMTTNNILWHGYFEYDFSPYEGDRRLNPIGEASKFPAAKAKFEQLFINGNTGGGPESVALGSPTAVQTTGSTTVNVQYNANSTRDIIVDIFDGNWNWKGQQRGENFNGSGNWLATVNYLPINTATAHLKVSLLPDGGSWNQSLAEDLIFDIPVGGGTAADFELKLWEADGSSGVNLINGWGVGSFDPGNWIRFDNVDLSSGYNDFAISYATTLNGQMELRLDSPTGTLIGTVNYTSNGNWSTYAWDGSPLNGSANGTHSVYIIMKSGTANVSTAWFKNN